MYKNTECRTMEDFRNLVGMKGNIKTSWTGHDLVGKIFISKKSFPKKADVESQYILTGGPVKIMEYSEEDKTYTLVNLSLSIGCENHLAWFKVDDSELDYLLRRNSTK